MRDYRIDFFRGLALAIIFIDHIPFNVYSYLTPRNYGLSDAAEMFVLISGISAAYAYFGRFSAGTPVLASLLAVKRAIILYFAQISGSVVILTIFAVGAVAFGLESLLVENNVGPFFENPVLGILGIASLGHQFGFFNILPMYMIILLMLPGIMYLMNRSMVLALLVSFAVYLATGTWRLNLPNFPTEGGWYFNPLAWQFLFTIGVAIGARLRSGNGIAYSPALYAACLVYLVVGAVWVLVPLWGTLPDLPLPFVLYGSDKTFLTMGRLLHVLAAAYVIGQSGVGGWLKGHLTALNPIVMIGRQGLASFCFGTFLSMIGMVLKRATNGGIAFDTIAVIVGLALMTALAGALDLLQKPKLPALSAVRGDGEAGSPAQAMATQ
jgi:hypothetical protein